MENVLFLCEKQNEFAHKMIDKKMFGKQIVMRKIILKNFGLASLAFLFIQKSV